MSFNRLSIEQVLYGLAILLALTLRLLNLGAIPLADSEAVLALQAFDVSQGEKVAIDPQPGFAALTGLTFALLGSSEFTARLWPALAGGLLVIVPYFLRRQLGRGAAIILAFGLAFDPGLVAVSRQADGPMLSVGFSLLVLGLAIAGYPILAGVAAGLALLSGPALLPGLLGLALAWGASLLFSDTEEGDQLLPAAWDEKALRKGVLAMLGTLVLVGTLFLRAPQGLGGWIAGLPSYLSGWAQPSGVPALRLVSALVVYQPLAVIFGLIGAIQGWLRGKRLVKVASLWLVFALILSILYPARQVHDLIWALIPLWILAALTLAGLFADSGENSMISLGHATILFIFMTLVWVNIAGLGQSEPGSPGYLTRLAVVGGVIALGAVTSGLIGLGWSWKTAQNGAVWGMCAILGIYTLAGMWWASQVRDPGRVELWQPFPSSAGTRLIIETVTDLSAWNIGDTQALDVTLAVDSPALHWSLRTFPSLSVIPEGEQLISMGSPAIVITRQDVEEPGLAAEYRGQDFVFRTYPGWFGALPPNILRWVAFRLAPLQEEQVIVWARADLFPGGSSLSEESPPAFDIPGLDEP